MSKLMGFAHVSSKISVGDGRLDAALARV